jgi:GNAT superfamily N-acetyltransferase
MTDISIRSATQADVALIFALLGELADYEKLQDKFHLSEALIARDMLGAVCNCELAFAGEAPCGIATWFWTYKSFRAARGIFLEDMYVRPEFRGRGLGRKLIAQLAAKAQGADGFLEWQVLDWNTPSIEFYKSLGATLVPQWVTCRLDRAALAAMAAS